MLGFLDLGSGDHLRGGGGLHLGEVGRAGVGLVDVSASRAHRGGAGGIGVGLVGDGVAGLHLIGVV